MAKHVSGRGRPGEPDYGENAQWKRCLAKNKGLPCVLPSHVVHRRVNGVWYWLVKL